MNRISILIADDDLAVREQLQSFFSEFFSDIFTASTEPEIFDILSNNSIDILVLDYIFPDTNGLTILSKVKTLHPHVEVIFITGHGNRSVIIKALELGAFDFFHKPLNGTELKNAVQRTSKYVNIAREKKSLTKSITFLLENLEKDVGKIIAKSDQMKKVINLALKAAKHTNTTVLIQGPTGSGKELIAKLVHYNSPRRQRLFYPVNCSAIADSLIESELFGYAKGAFTGASGEKTGIFEYADGGTLFLDEIGDMPLELQAKLLRVLEGGEIRKIGSRKIIPVDIRIIAASNKDLKELVSRQQFREDLYHRINTFQLFLPPLKEHKEDIPPLIDHFLEEISFKTKNIKKTLTDEARSALLAYTYPGNIRELRNIIERAIIISETNLIELEDLSISYSHNTSEVSTTETIKKRWLKKHTETGTSLDFTILDDIEREILTTALHRCSDNRTRAAELTGVSRQSFTRKLKKHNLL